MCFPLAIYHWTLDNKSVCQYFLISVDLLICVLILFSQTVTLVFYAIVLFCEIGEFNKA